MTRRTERIDSLIRREISDLLRRQINDPRLASLISVTKVVTSADLKHAKVFVSAVGDNVDRKEILQGFSAASRFLRSELAGRLTLRYVPELSFHFDDSIEHAARVLELIDQVAADNAEVQDGN